ncbi:putative protein TPRXL isoform X2 [Passer montanus]|uniref:putative protein TPRXL isoform X2 n=1 Tax=Passer montanus TaxID=9160 RepID=UPI00195F8A26|nr:putative protein TPRXL isoform X2 [Passer montanus]
MWKSSESLGRAPSCQDLVPNIWQIFPKENKSQTSGKPQIPKTQPGCPWNHTTTGMCSRGTWAGLGAGMDKSLYGIPGNSQQGKRAAAQKPWEWAQGEGEEQLGEAAAKQGSTRNPSINTSTTSTSSAARTSSTSTRKPSTARTSTTRTRKPSTARTSTSKPNTARSNKPSTTRTSTSKPSTARTSSTSKTSPSSHPVTADSFLAGAPGAAPWGFPFLLCHQITQPPMTWGCSSRNCSAPQTPVSRPSRELLVLLGVLVAPTASRRQRDTDQAPGIARLVPSARHPAPHETHPEAIACPSHGDIYPSHGDIYPSHGDIYPSHEALTGSTAPSPHPPERLRWGEGTSRTGNRESPTEEAALGMLEAGEEWDFCPFAPRFMPLPWLRLQGSQTSK